LAGVLAGAIWGGLAGVLRAYRGSHEVITTIMLNFVAAALASYVTLYLLKNPDVQNPETLAVGSAYLVDKWAVFQGAPLGWGSIVVIAVLTGVHFWMDRTARGFESLAVGDSPRAARVAGISVERVQILAMAMAGGLAGLVGFLEILGNSGKFRPAFSPDYGFMGIAVALLGRARPIGVLLAALLFGALHKGSVDLDFETENVTRDISKVIQACVIFVVSADGLWAMVREKMARRDQQ
jgi:simple sugar transport system permease protein